MLIDWFTIGAQALNFLILCWLLKRFLYQPVLDAIDGREARIAAQIADATAKEQQATSEREALRAKTKTLEDQRQVLLDQAVQAAQAERVRLLEAARLAAEQLGAGYRDTLRREAGQLRQALRDRARHEVFGITRQALADLATSSLETRMVEVFIERLRMLDPAPRATLADALKQDATGARLRSAFDLPPAQRAALQAAVRENLAADRPLCFELAPELVGGLELVAGGQKLAWNFLHYVDALDQVVDDLLTTASPG